RRHYVAWSPLTKNDFPHDYWDELWGWYRNGGFEHVAAYLAELDLSDFDPKAPPPKTAAFWEIVSMNRAPEDDELSDVIEKLGNPGGDAARAARCSGEGRGGRWAEGPQEPPHHPTSARTLRLHISPQSLLQGRTLEDRRRESNGLRQDRAVTRDASEGGTEVG